VPCLSKRESLRNDWLYFFLPEQFQQRGQIVPEQIRFQSFERLDAVRYDSFAARKEPAAGQVQRVNGNTVKAIATTFTSGTQSLAAQ